MRGTLLLVQEGARSRAISDRISASGSRETATLASCKGCAVPVADDRGVRYKKSQASLPSISPLGAIWRSRPNWLVGQTRAAFVTSFVA
jgi:hypothetical protein